MMRCFTEEVPGRLPTASAVVGDVIDVARNLQFGLQRKNQLYLLSGFAGEAV